MEYVFPKFCGASVILTLYDCCPWSWLWCDLTEFEPRGWNDAKEGSIVGITFSTLEPKLQILYDKGTETSVLTDMTKKVFLNV